MIAAGIILIAIFSIIFNNPLQQEVEIQTIANSFTSVLQTIDACSYETSTNFLFPRATSMYQISLSPESITFSKNNSETIFVFRKSFLTKPWIRETNDAWINTSEFHQYLLLHFGSKGTQSNPLANSEELYQHLQEEWNTSFSYFLFQPYTIVTSEPVHIEKCILYLDSNSNGIWEKADEKLEYLLVYQ